MIIEPWGMPYLLTAEHVARMLFKIVEGKRKYASGLAHTVGDAHRLAWIGSRWYAWPEPKEIAVTEVDPAMLEGTSVVRLSSNRLALNTNDLNDDVTSFTDGRRFQPLYRVFREGGRFDFAAIRRVVDDRNGVAGLRPRGALRDHLPVDGRPRRTWSAGDFHGRREVQRSAAPRRDERLAGLEDEPGRGWFRMDSGEGYGGRPRPSFRPGQTMPDRHSRRVRQGVPPLEAQGRTRESLWGERGRPLGDDLTDWVNAEKAVKKLY